MTKPFTRIGMVARWRPVHLGHLPVLEALCQQATTALIGIGSSNRYNARNPFTLEETTAMLELVLAAESNYTLLPIPDLDDGPRWRAMILELFGPLERFVTDNPYVANLLKEDYHVIRPVHLVPPTRQIPLDGTMVRRAMARGEAWEQLLPPEIATYITTHQLDARFRREFGLETLALDSIVQRSTRADAP